MVGAVRVGYALLVGLCLFGGTRASDEKEEKSSDVLRRILARLERERTELQGYITGNTTEQGNWTVVRTPSSPDARPERHR